MTRPGPLHGPSSESDPTTMPTAANDTHRTLVEEITDAVADYEHALARHDLDALHEWFSEDPSTLRAEHTVCSSAATRSMSSAGTVREHYHALWTAST